VCVCRAAAKNITPVTMELGGKSPLIFFKSCMDHNDNFLDKCLESAVMFALNQGEVCTCPSRVLIQEDIYEKFIKLMVARAKAIKTGHPLDPTTMIGAQASQQQYEKIQVSLLLLFAKFISGRRTCQTLHSPLRQHVIGTV
jgi:aldehyde dehydrogenase